MGQKVLPKRNIVKAITWRVVGTVDLFLISWLFTGDPARGFEMGVTDTLAKLVFYYIHERIWVHIDLKEYPKLKNTRRRHVYKALTWRVFSSSITVMIVWLILGDPFKSITITIIESVIQLILYYFHEQLWHKSKYGLTDQP